MDNNCVVCWKGRCSYVKCKYCQCCICKQCMTKMLKLYKEGNDFLRLCPNCRSNLNWARKKNGTIIAFPDFDYDDIMVLNPNPLRPILNIYHILLSFTGITVMVFILCKLLTTMHFEDKGMLFLVLITLLPFLVR